jgi:hypothetical protein
MINIPFPESLPGVFLFDLTKRAHLHTGLKREKMEDADGG